MIAARLWTTAFDLAWESFSMGSYGVGGLVANSEGEVVATGRNLIASPAAGGDRLGSTPIAHAELNALASLCGLNTGETSVVSTLSPCAMCFAAISVARIPLVVYAGHDAGSDGILTQPPYAGSTPPSIFHEDLGELSALAELLPLARSIQQRGTDSRPANVYRTRNAPLLSLAKELAASAQPNLGLGQTPSDALELLRDRLPPPTIRLVAGLIC
ncbi:MAG: hypothetical protein QOG10_920 [Kribbellaceae bacterium]|jgi:tRNA(Arg) A34 adenosine deaminase TadA|nr:hypothetical protein [Kribbellaceae bacterium]